MAVLQYQNPATVDAVLDSVLISVGPPEVRREIIVLGDATGANLALVGGRIPVDGSGVTQPISFVSPQHAIIDSGNVNVTGALSVISSNNSSTTTLGAGGTFTGLADNLFAFKAITIYCFADQASAVGGFNLEWSSDGTHWDDVQSYSVAAGESRVFSQTINANFFRVVYTNGGTIQGAFRLQVILHPVSINERKKPLNVIFDPDEPAIITHSVIAAKGPAGSYLDIGASTEGGLSVAGTGASNPNFATWNSGTANNTAIVMVNNSLKYNSVAVEFVGASGIGSGVATFEVSIDAVNWVGITGFNTSTSSPNANGNTFSFAVGATGLLFNIVGYPYFRTRLSTVITSGTVAISYTIQSLTSANVSTSVSGGSINVNSNQGNPNAASNAWPMKIFDNGPNGPVSVKQASTAAVAADLALVVAISPNNTVDIGDRAARLLGVVYGSQGQQLKQTATNFNSQVELATGATLYDARQIRALTSADVISAAQGTAAAVGGAWPVEITDGVNVLGTSAHPVRVDPTGTTTQPINLASWASTALGTPTNFGVTPGAVIAGSVNASLFSGTTGLTNTGSALDVNLKTSSITLPVSQATAANLNATVVGSQSNNSSADTGKDIPVLSVFASAGAPTWAQGNIVFLTSDLSGNLRTIANQLIGVAGFEKITDGVNTAAVKAASTAAVAADPSLVVALSPNSPLPAGAAVIGALVANQSVNLAQVAGTNTLTGGSVGSLGIGGLQADNTALVGNPVPMGINNSGNILIPTSAGAIGDATNGGRTMQTGIGLFNGITWDRLREGTILGSALVQDTNAGTSLVALASQTKRSDQIVDLLQQIISRLDAHNLMFASQTDTQFIDAADVASY